MQSYHVVRKCNNIKNVVEKCNSIKSVVVTPLENTYYWKIHMKNAIGNKVLTL